MNRIYLAAIIMFCPIFIRASQNDSIISYVKKHGYTLAPSYKEVVCTNFLVKVLQHFTKVDKITYQRIQIITSKPISQLLEQKSEIPNGVCYALTSKGLGKYVTLEEAKSGDFVQFWNSFFGIYSSGHCGILDHIDYDQKKIYMYSSHPQTDGFGLHVFDMPDYVVFARLK